MDRIVLKNKPLVEAIFEYRWALKVIDNNIREDPFSNILVGSLFERIKKKYPFYEKLPSAEVPSMLAEYLPQYRFRVGDGLWPLIQVGPGIITVNETKEYIWEDFKDRISDAVSKLYSVYPKGNGGIVPKNLILRYIDSMPFNFMNENIIEFLKKYLKVNIGIYGKLFEKTGVDKAPKGIDIRLAFKSVKPKGIIGLRIFRGKRDNIESIMWETTVTSSDQTGLPSIPSALNEWLEKAHIVTDKWFFSLIEGELLEKFK
ncbi:TIGR04255 family protein [Patescibacteria group bacterium]|nr:TIGR04255 family protein [Patescibacteria group bacterium]